MSFLERSAVTVTGNQVKVDFTVPEGVEVREITGSILDNSVFSVCDGITRVLGWITDPIGTIPVMVDITSLNQTSNPKTYLIRSLDHFVASGSFSLEFYTLLTSYQGEKEHFRVVYAE